MLFGVVVLGKGWRHLGVGREGKGSLWCGEVCGRSRARSYAVETWSKGLVLGGIHNGRSSLFRRVTRLERVSKVIIEPETERKVSIERVDADSLLF